MQKTRLLVETSSAGGLKRLASDTVVYGVSTVLGRVLNVLLVPLYTYTFQPSDFGVMTLVFTLMAFMQVVYTLGIETAYFRFSEKQAKDESSVLGAGLGTIALNATLLSGLIALAAGALAEPLLGSARWSPLLQWAALILWFDALAAIPFARLRRQNRAWRFAAIKLGSILLNIAINLVVLVAIPHWLQQGEGSSWQGVYERDQRLSYIFMANAISSGLALALLIPALRWKRPPWRPRLSREMLAYGGPLILVSLAGMANETLDRYLLRWWLPGSEESRLAAVGIYSACYKLSIFMTLVVQAFRYAAEPFFFAKAQQEDARETYALIMRLFVLLGGGVVLGVTFLLDIVKWAIDPAYHEGLGIVPVLLVANLFLGMYYNLSVWYKVSGHTGMGAWVALAGLGITLLGNALLIPALGYPGAAWTTLACYGGMTALSWALSRRYYTIPYAWRRIGRYLLVAIGLTAFFWWWRYRFFEEWNAVLVGLSALSAGAYALMARAGEKTIFERLLKIARRSASDGS